MAGLRDVEARAEGRAAPYCVRYAGAFTSQDSRPAADWCSPRAAEFSPKPLQEFVMQMIEAVIKPHKLDAVKTALAKLGILGVTAVECKGFGRQMGHTERYRGAKMDVGFVPKVLLKICVKGEESARAVTEIMEAARTGEVGDGKIFVYPVAEVIRIRTGEKNEQAL
jgi:nitrogen regulatory protein PII